MKIINNEWKTMLYEYIKNNFNEERDYLIATDFKYNVFLKFGDGSFVFFNYSFYLLNEDRTEIAIFSEHCGYHYFSFLDCEVELFKTINHI